MNEKIKVIEERLEELVLKVRLENPEFKACQETLEKKVL